MNILLFTRYGRLGSSSRLRSFQYLPYLNANNINVTSVPLLNDKYLKKKYSYNIKAWDFPFKGYFQRLNHLLKSHQFDLLWIEKELFPWLPAWVEVLLTWFGIPYIVDYDDAIFHRYDFHQSGMVRTLLGCKIDVVMQRAALVTVGNDYLAERARQAGAKRVEIIPTVIDLNKYKVASQANSKVFTIGWIGSPFTSKFLHSVYSPIAEICKRGNVRLLLIGAGSDVGFNDLPIENRIWSEETEVTDIQSIDLGIMPLPNEPWERGKCGYKLIQYMACGKPVIASPVGINKKIVEDGINGFLATTPIEWMQALRILHDNYSLRKRMGIAGRKKIENDYCLQVTYPRLINIFFELEKEIKLRKGN